MKPKLPREQFFKRQPRRLREWWRNFYNSAKNYRMSRGGLNIFKIISWARSENWRRNTKRSEKKFTHKKD